MERTDFNARFKDKIKKKQQMMKDHYKGNQKAIMSGCPDSINCGDVAGKYNIKK